VSLSSPNLGSYGVGLVTPVNVFGDPGDLTSTAHLAFDDAVEPFQFPVRLRMVDAA
jgi:hypothetical protein